MPTCCHKRRRIGAAWVYEEHLARYLVCVACGNRWVRGSLTVGISIALCFYLVTMDHRKNTSLAYDPDFLTTNFFEAKCQQSHKQRLKTMKPYVVHFRYLVSDAVLMGVGGLAGTLIAAPTRP